MRNPKRIPIILKRLQVIWEQMPDMRLGQLIGNVYHSTDSGGNRQYYEEDEKLIDKVEKGYTRTQG